MLNMQCTISFQDRPVRDFNAEMAYAPGSRSRVSLGFTMPFREVTEARLLSMDDGPRLIQIDRPNRKTKLAFVESSHVGGVTNAHIQLQCRIIPPKKARALRNPRAVTIDLANLRFDGCSSYVRKENGKIYTVLRDRLPVIVADIPIVFRLRLGARSVRGCWIRYSLIVRRA